MIGARNSQVLRAIPFLILICLLSPPAHSKYGGGTGEPNDPYLIRTAEQLNTIGAEPNDWDKHFKLTADIDLCQSDDPWQPIGPFSGVFDGNDHVIKNLGHTDPVPGLFSGVDGYDALVKNLGLIDPNIQGVWYVGGLVGYLSAGTIQRCYVQGGTVKGDRSVGGLVGECFHGTIEGCRSSADVVASQWYGGGLVGSASGRISNCSSGGSVSGESVGGLVGMSYAVIADCYSTGYVNGANDVGGLVGQNGDLHFGGWPGTEFVSNKGAIRDSYSIATVEGNDGVGGLVGHNIAGTITGCRSYGQVSGANDVGGLVGKQGYCTYGSSWHRFAGEVRNCFSRATVTGNNRVGGLIGFNWAGSITRCYSTGPADGVRNVGGLVGENGWWRKYYPTYPPSGWPELYESVGEVRNCYSRGDVKGLDTVGGLVGYSGAGPIANSYSAGAVVGNKDVGGLLGANDNGTVRYCFWDIQTSDQRVMCGYRGLGGIGCNNANGKTTAEMQMATTFAAWACDPVWTINEHVDYPRLFWEMEPGQRIIKLSYPDGSGTKNDPYLIYTPEQLNAIGLYPCDRDKHFKLMADIDLAGMAYSTAVIPEFAGTLDGNGFAISNLTIAGRDHLGLIGVLRSGGRARNLGVVDANVAGTGGNIGILVARNSGDVVGSYGTGSVGGDFRVGCLVGDNSGTIVGCSTTGTLSASGSQVGGLVGQNYGGTINSCCAAVAISGERDVGGFIGKNTGIVADCYSTGPVDANDRVGGLVGWNNAVIANCYSTGQVDGNDYVGGLVGYDSEQRATASFWDKQSSGEPNSAGGTGKNTAEMHDPNTFIDAGWDFVGLSDGPHDMWAKPPEGGYPILCWQLSTPREQYFAAGTGEPNDPYVISTADELNSIGHNPRLMGAHFELSNDVNLVDVNFFTIGNDLFPFAGSFDGNGKTISGLSHFPSNEDCVGLFGCVDGPDAQVMNLGLIDPNVALGFREPGVGGLKPPYLGALIGRLMNGTVSCCHVSGEKGQVRQSWGFAGSSVGGLVGCSGGTIENCYSEVSVFQERSFGELPPGAKPSVAGGLLGRNQGIVRNCLATGPVLNGLGLVGANDAGTVSGSLWDRQTTWQHSSAGGEGKTTEELHRETTFIGWGCDPVWTIDEGVDYPRLWWENMPGQTITYVSSLTGELVCPAGIDFLDLAIFAGNWRQPNCHEVDDCYGADLDASGAVDFADLSMIAESWLLPPEVAQPSPPSPPGPPKRTCFPGETPVWVDGAIVPISNTVSGQMLPASDCDLATLWAEEIEKVEQHEGVFECYDILLETGNSITIADSHYFLADSGRWVAVQNLERGSSLQSINGPVRVRALARRATPLVGTVYNLKVKDGDRYSVGKDGVIARDY